MLNSIKKKRLGVVRANLNRYYTLLAKWEEKKIFAKVPEEELECEYKIKELKEKIVEAEQELIQIGYLPEEVIPDIPKRKTLKYIIIGIVVLTLISTTLYFINTSNKTYFTNEKKNDSVITENDSIITVPEVELKKKSFKIILKISTEPCSQKDFKKFPTGKVHLNIWVNKPTKSKLRINWGDGFEDIIISKSLNCYSVSHVYLTMGKKEIIIYLIHEKNKDAKIAHKNITINSI